MLGQIILVLIGITGAVLAFRSEHSELSKKRKKRYGLLIMVVAIIGLFVSNYYAYQDSEKSSNQLDKVTVKLDSSNVELGALRHESRELHSQNDSLLADNLVLKSMLQIAHDKIDDLRHETVEGFSQNLARIETIGKATRARVISEGEKNEMATILSQSKGKIHLELTMNDQEVVQFAEQLKEVFAGAGWQVTRKYEYVMEDSPFHGVKLLIKDPANPPGGLAETIRAMDAVGQLQSKTLYLFPKAVREQKLQDYVYIRIGLK